MSTQEGEDVDKDRYNYRTALAAPIVLDIMPSAAPLPAVDAKNVLTFEGTKTKNPFATRPARRQVKKGQGPIREFTHHSSEYNIWYHKKLGDKYEQTARMKATTRCVVATDAGYTKADKGNKDTYLCLYFARGHCSNGPECSYYHRTPLEEDELRLDSLHDVFGRERHRTYREDMGGVGSFNRNNHTLYVAGLKRNATSEEIVIRHFSEWGKIEYVRVLWDKCIAFVRYAWRSSAEFAKEAMIDQSLNEDEVLVIKWANEDPNPAAQNKEEMRNLLQVAEVVDKKLKEEEEIYQYQNPNGEISYQQFPAPNDPSQYPVTNHQYSSNSHTNSSQVVEDWLKKVGQEEKLKGLENYRDSLISSGYTDLSSLSQLDDISLDAAGISKVEHRSSLLEAAKALKKQMETKKSEEAQQNYYTSQEYYNSQEYYDYYNSVVAAQAAQAAAASGNEAYAYTNEEYSEQQATASYANYYNQSVPQQQQYAYPVQQTAYEGGVPKPLVDYGSSEE